MGQQCCKCHEPPKVVVDAPMPLAMEDATSELKLGSFVVSDAAAGPHSSAAAAPEKEHTNASTVLAASSREVKCVQISPLRGRTGEPCSKGAPAEVARKLGSETTVQEAATSVLDQPQAKGQDAAAASSLSSADSPVSVVAAETGGTPDAEVANAASDAGGHEEMEPRPSYMDRRPSTMSSMSDMPGGRRRRNSAIGKKFPRRPSLSGMSEALWSKAEELFRAMDQDNSNAVTRQEAMDFFQGAFKKASMEAMFNEVDQDRSGAITAQEFMDFWRQVRACGYSEQDILDEMDELLNGSTWVDWNDGRDTGPKVNVTFPKRPWLCKLSKEAWKKCEELYRKIDGDGTLQITELKAEEFFKGAFSTMSVAAMFNEIDVNHHGQITPKAFMDFWVQVKGSGYKEKDILSELDGLMEGGPWVDWKDGRTTNGTCSRPLSSMSKTSSK